MTPYVRQFRQMKPEEQTRQERWERMNQFVQSRNGWITSRPGHADIVIECLPGSTLPEELRKAGYDLTDEGQRERILAGSIIEQFGRNAEGELIPWSEGMQVAEMRTHAGIVKVERFSFEIS